MTQPSGAAARYAYDAEGDLATVTDATGRDWTYAHDDFGRITSIEDSRWATGPGGPAPATLAFGHDADGRLAR